MSDRDVLSIFKDMQNKHTIRSRAEIDSQRYHTELPNWCSVFHFLSFINPSVFVQCSLLSILYIISPSFGEGYINLNPLSAASTPPGRRPGGFCYFYLIIS